MRFRRRTDDEIPAEAVAHLPPTPGLEGLGTAAQIDCDIPAQLEAAKRRGDMDAEGNWVIRSTDVLPVRKRGRRT